MPKLYPGNSLPKLAKLVADQSDIKLGGVISDKFPNGELKIKVDPVNDQTFLMQSFAQPVHDHIIEYLLMADALYRAGSMSITGIIPWFGYSKQDKVFTSGEPLSAKVIAKLIQTTKTTHMVTIDLHNPSIMGYFDIPVTNVSAMPLFVEYIKQNHDKENSIVISPDAGSVKSSTHAADSLELPIAYMNKKRNLVTGEVTVKDIDRPVEGMDAIVFDDMIATGSTLVKTSQFLKEKKVKSVTVCATHHLYISGVADKLSDAPIDQLIVSDTIQKPEKINPENMTVISVSALIADKLKAMG